jgi:hypothetical protein
MPLLLKIIRTVGVGTMLMGFFQWATSRAVRDGDFHEPLEQYTLTNRRIEACRALGLPDEWRYDEDRLRLARGVDSITTARAVNFLMGLHNEPRLVAVLDEENKQARLASPYRRPPPVIDAEPVARRLPPR